MLNTLPPGQKQARTRWGTHESGAAFDKKKTPYLTEQAQEFLAQQSFCVIASLGTHQEISGLLAMEKPGFARVLDQQTCLLELDQYTDSSPMIQILRQTAEKPAHLGLFFINHISRERLCVQGEVRLVPTDSPLHSHPSPRQQKLQLLLHVRQAFFHCSKYIRTRVAGLTAACPDSDSSGQCKQLHLHIEKNQHCLTEETIAFLRQQVLSFLCTIDQEGHCAVNHRGGKPGFLVPFPPAATAPGGFILLPDYAGNGAFEAIGNILETHQAALLIPNYATQMALCLNGRADIISVRSLPTKLRHRCAGAQRVLALQVHHIEMQAGDWSATLAYEQERAQNFIACCHPMLACPR